MKIVNFHKTAALILALAAGLDIDTGVSAGSTTVNLAATYSTSYSSGAPIFGGSDSQGEQNKLYRKIIERKHSI